jgi:magnesium transporter
MIRSLHRGRNGSLSSDLTPAQMKDALAEPEGTLWIDVLLTPDNHDEVARLLADLFAFHPLAVEDALQESHVPRVDDWESYLYVVLHAARRQARHRLDTVELDAFLGRRYLVTVHEEPIAALDHLWDQSVRGAERRLGAGPQRLFYALADAVVADYMLAVDDLDEEIDHIEAEVFRRPRAQLIGRIFAVRRGLLRLRRTFAALREVMNRLARDDYEVIEQGDRIYFRDVYDHLVRLYDIVEGLRDVVGGALDSYLGVTSNRINNVMRTLTAVTVLFLPMSFLAGFFGMNFFGDTFNVNNPVSSTTLFWLCMALMVITPLGLLSWMIGGGMIRAARGRNGPHDLDG